MHDLRVGVLRRRGRFVVAEPFFEAGPRVAVSRDGRAAVGDLVAVRSRPHRDGRGARAVIASRLGRPEIARDVIEAFMIDRGLKRSFPTAVEREAASAVTTDSDRHRRRDLRSLQTFTIDPVDARDFDDAISAVAEAGGWRVWVHIADVAAHVPAGSPLDREAYHRGCSVYAPGAVEPMLPAALSSGACSLVPGRDRLGFTAELLVRDGGVQTAAFYRSLIRSDARLDYGQVDRIFAGTGPAPERCDEALQAARHVAASLQRRREQHGALAISSEEPEFRFDKEGNVLEALPVVQTESHRLIEHLMIAANEQVAKLLSGRGTPTLYRVHERPDGLAVERLVEQLASLGVPTPPLPKGPLSPEQAAAAVGEASQLMTDYAVRTGRGRRAFASLLLRSLKQAYYDHRNLGHAGLRSASYCHFTSPIRRYPDLICHRALLAAVAGEAAPDTRWVAAAGPWTSAREREAMTIERDADDIARCFLLDRMLANVGHQAEFEGEVTGLVSSGAFVAFGPNRQFEGMLPVRRLIGDWWELNELGTVLHGTRTGRTIRLGDPIQVQVGTIDAPRGRVDLDPVTASDHLGG
ncbi:MAG: ribonuclease R family protein [Solirubrobacteraceae bacterium]